MTVLITPELLKAMTGPDARPGSRRPKDARRWFQS